MGVRRHNVCGLIVALLIVLFLAEVGAATDVRLDRWLPFLVMFRYHQTLYLIQPLEKNQLSDFEEPHGIFCRLTLAELHPAGQIPLTLGDFKP